MINKCGALTTLGKGWAPPPVPFEAPWGATSVGQGSVRALHMHGMDAWACVILRLQSDLVCC